MSNDAAPEDSELPPASPGKPQKNKGRAALAFLMAGVGAVLVAGGALLLQKPPSAPLSGPAADAPVPGADGVFVGHHHYVVALPKDYVAIQSFKDSGKNAEVVHFCKLGTDPTNFLNDGLYGQLGIVRLEVQPTALEGPDGITRISQMVTAKASQRQEKLAITNLQAGSLRGIQVAYDVPFPRVESFLLGDRLLFVFHAGQDDEIYRSILQSLRDTRSEL